MTVPWQKSVWACHLQYTIHAVVPVLTTRRETCLTIKCSSATHAAHIFISVLSPISETFHIKDSSTRPLLSMDRPMPRGGRDSAWPPPWRGPDISRPIHHDSILSLLRGPPIAEAGEPARMPIDLRCPVFEVPLPRTGHPPLLRARAATRGSPCMIEDKPISEQ
jgi:hypothetical protein